MNIDEQAGNVDLFLKEIKYAYENVPFYGTMLKEMGVDIRRVSGANYSDLLPFTEKRDYRKNFPKGALASGYTLNHPMLTKSQSSGTTGERLITFEVGMNLLERAMKCANVHPAISRAFMKPSRKILRYAAPNCSDVECANPNSSMEDRILPDGTLVLPVFHDLLTTSEKLINRAIDEILIYEADLFYVDPTHFAFLLGEFEKRNIKPPQIPVLTSYSAATQVSIRQIECFYSRDMFSELLSSSEMGWVAMTCPKGHFHLNDDSFFVEFARGQAQDATGVFTELCISSTDQGAVPHLRYRTGDMVTALDSPCVCGQAGHPIKIEGRLTHFITQSGKPSLSPAQVDAMIMAPEWLSMYQLEQASDQRFTLKVICRDTPDDADTEQFIQTLRDALSTPVDVKIERLSYIASERSGKFQPVKGRHTDG